jgi:hypothetical protein
MDVYWNAVLHCHKSYFKFLNFWILLTRFGFLAFMTICHYAFYRSATGKTFPDTGTSHSKLLFIFLVETSESINIYCTQMLLAF